MALSDNLVAYYKFENNTDSSVGSIGATNSGATYTASGKIGGAYDFNGSSNYMTANWGSNPGTFSISVWVYIDGNTGNDFIFVNRVGSTGNYHWMYYDGSALWVSRWNGTTENIVNRSISSGSWQHIVYTCVPSSRMRIYVNGSYTQTSSIAGGNTEPNASWTLAARPAFTDHLDAKIDEVGYWNRELTPDEVTELYNSGTGLTYPFALTDGLVLHWNLNSTANDSTANANNGTLNGTSTVTGLIGDGQEFDADADRATLPSSLTGAPTTNVTYQFWVKASAINAQNNLFGYKRQLIRITTTALLWWADIDLSNVSATTTFTTGVWYHIVITQSGTSYTLYRNGTSIGSGTTNSLDWGTPISANAGLSYYDGSTGFRAVYDEFAIWSRALSSAEVTELYNGGNGLAYPFSSAAPADNSLFFGGGL